MASRTPRADGLAVAPNAVADANNPAADVDELLSHRFWGRFATAAALPNASGNAAANPAYGIMRPGDVAWVQADGLLYQLQDRGTLSGSDAVWAVVGGGASYVSTGCSGYTAANYYTNASAVLRGNATGFVVGLAFRVIGLPSDFGTMIGNFQIFQPNGGWYISIDPSSGVRVVFGVGQVSDGQLIENGGNGYLSYNGPSGIGPWWKENGRIYVAILTFDGTDATGWLNGERVAILTPGAGYDPSDVTSQPYIGRNANAGAPYPMNNVEVIGAGYLETVGGISQQEIIDHTLATMQQGDFVDLPTTGFDNMWSFAGEATPPATLADLVGGIDFTLTGASLVTTTRRTIW